jgi:hypothetical protein
VFEYRINRKKADHHKINAPWSGKDEEERVWVHYSYYYYPDIELYLQIETGTWFFLDGSKWKAVQILPPRKKKEQMQNNYKVKLNYTGCNPTLLHRMNKAKYPPREKVPGKKNSMRKENKTRKTRTFYIPVDKSDLVACDIDNVEMSFHQN